MKIKEVKETAKQKVGDAVAYCKLHRSSVIAAVTAFIGGLGSSIFIAKKLSGKINEGKETDERHCWQDDEDFEEATIQCDDESIHGAWFITEKGGKIFFAEDEDGNLP